MAEVGHWQVQASVGKVHESNSPVLPRLCYILIMDNLCDRFIVKPELENFNFTRSSVFFYFLPFFLYVSEKKKNKFYTLENLNLVR